MGKTALIVTSVASMIDQFNKPNIEILIELGYNVTIATNFEKPGNLTKEKVRELFEYFHRNNIQYVQIAMDRFPFTWNNLNVLKSLSNLIKKNKYDIIHCQSPVGGVLTRIAARQQRNSIIYTAHGFHFYKDAPKMNWLVYYPIEYILSFLTNILITINKEDYTNSLKLKATQKVYIPGVGIDTNKIKNLSVNVQNLRKEIGIPPNDRILISVGELNNNKNHKVILEALASLSLNNVHYLLCGMGALEEELIEYAKKLQISDRVHFLGFREDVLYLMKISDLFVFPSFREGLPFSLMEAMASGLPAVVSNIRGNTDLVDEDKGGKLAEPMAVEQWVICIEELLANQKIRLRMKNYNLKKIKEFDIKRIDEQMMKIYKKVGNADS